MPAVIFATAYDRYAVKAFDLHAIDYLLKPFTNKRFYESLALAKERIRDTSLQHINQKLSTILAGYSQEKDTQEADVLIHQNTASLADKLVIKSSGKIYFISKKEIIWIEAYDSYVKIHIGGKYHLVRESMKNIEEKLPVNIFARIHKSSIVNINFIAELEPYFNGEFVVKLSDGTELKLSRSYRNSFMGLFEK
jgi:two-component system LytT family response regulator